MNNKLKIVSIIAILTVFIASCTTTVWAVDEINPVTPSSSQQVIVSSQQVQSDYTSSDNTVQPYAPNNNNNQTIDQNQNQNQYNNNTNSSSQIVYDNTPNTHSASSNEYQFFESGDSSSPNAYNGYGSSSSSSTASLYDVSSRNVDSDTLDSEAWKMALSFDENDADAGTGNFDFIKNNTSEEDSTASRWIFYVGCALLALSLFGIIFIIVTVVNRSKRIKMAAQRNARRRNGFNSNRTN